MSSNVISIIIALCFLAIKLVENKISTNKPEKPLKQIIRDTLFVYVSAMAGFFLHSQIEPLTNSVTSSIPNVFMSEPDF